MTDDFSYSSLSQYMKCPLQFFFQRVLGLPRRTTPGPLALGSALHEALAHYHRSVQRCRSAAREEIVRVFREAWRRQKEETLIVYAQGDEQGHLDQGVALVEAYLGEPPPPGIVAVEHELRVPLVTSQGEVLDRQLVAILDLITRDADGLKVTDIKSSSKAYSDLEARTSLQATVYLHAATEHFQETAAFEFTVLVKTKKPKVQRARTARMPDDFVRLGDIAQTVERAVDAGIFYPVESAFNCSTCSYRKPCREWQSSQTLTEPGRRIPLELAGEDGCS